MDVRDPWLTITPTRRRCVIHIQAGVSDILHRLAGTCGRKEVKQRGGIIDCAAMAEVRQPAHAVKAKHTAQQLGESLLEERPIVIPDQEHEEAPTYKADAHRSTTMLPHNQTIAMCLGMSPPTGVVCTLTCT